MDQRTVSRIIGNINLAESTISRTINAAECIRLIDIEIRNDSRFKLIKPKWFMISGKNQVPPSPVIKPSCRAICSFRKTNFSLRGTVGILTYEFEDKNPIKEIIQQMKITKQKTLNPTTGCTKLVLMWSVPFDRNTCLNYHAIGIKKDVTEDINLFESMYKKEGKNKSWFVIKKAKNPIEYTLPFKCTNIKLSAKMSDVGTCKWIIHLE